MLSQFAKNRQQNNEQIAQESIPRLPIKDNRAVTSLKKPDTNRSLDSGNKSVSASKSNLLPKKI